MKTTAHNIMRRALAGITTGLALGALFAMSSRADIYRIDPSVIGGIPAQSVITSGPQAGTNSTISWYGLQGWYSVEAAPSLAGPWTSLGTTAATDFAWQLTVANPDPTNNSYVFRLNQANSFSGSGNCSSCHGDKFAGWSKTPHASALSLLKNIHMDGNASCLPCHTVGFGQPTGYTNATVTPYLTDVGCENCHGAANWHKNGDHSLIRPAVSMDPAICGSCHQDSHHPTYEEYSETLHAQVNLDIKLGNAAATQYYTNTAIIGTNVYYGYFITTNANSTLKTNATTGIISSSHVPGSPVDPGQSRGVQCGVCHSAATRKAMLDEYYDNLAGSPHTLNLPTAVDAGAWTATCATCHDPHSTNNVAQLRYPTWSTNFYTMATTTDTYTGPRRATNALGYVQTETLYKNTTFDSMYNPQIQVCAQCHNSRGATWDGTTYGLITNSLVSTATNRVRVDWFTNGQWTAYYVTNVVTSTNKAVVVGLTTPLITYVVGGVTNTTINSSGYGRAPHHSPQYNILVGKPDTNFYLAASIHSHGSAGNANQCATCHVPSYSVNANTNVTGHTFEMDLHNCVQCHTGLTDAAYEAKIEDLQYQESNSIARVVGLLNKWATTPGVAPEILRTNYGSLAWEYTTPGELGNPSGSTALGPPSAYSSKFGSAPAGTNDNMQLAIPASIRKARFNLYMVAHDGSLGVHNPTFTKTMLTDAESQVMGVFTASNYPASFSVFPVTYAALITAYVGTNVVFTNLTATAGGTWNFGDGNTTNVAQRSVAYAYSVAGLYSVTYTDTSSGSSLTKQAYIQVRENPVLNFAADVTSGLAPLTATFTNTSTGIGSVDWWRWQFNSADSSTRLETTEVTPISFTYTNIGTNSVLLRANLSAGGNASLTKTSYIIVSGLSFTSGPTNGAAPLSVSFTNKSVGMSNLVWTFGDGTTSAVFSPSHIYTNAGTYTVTLNGDYNGATYALVRTSLVVVNPAPVASFYAATTSGKAPLYVPFINTSGNATSYLWSFGDGQTATNMYIDHIYTNAGTYTVTLKAIKQNATNALTRTNYIIVNP